MHHVPYYMIYVPMYWASYIPRSVVLASDQHLASATYAWAAHTVGMVCHLPMYVEDMHAYVGAPTHSPAVQHYPAWALSTQPLH